MDCGEIFAGLEPSFERIGRVLEDRSQGSYCIAHIVWPRAKEEVKKACMAERSREPWLRLGDVELICAETAKVATTGGLFIDLTGRSKVEMDLPVSPSDVDVLRRIVARSQGCEIRGVHDHGKFRHVHVVCNHVDALRRVLSSLSEIGV